MKLYAISDIHISHETNRKALEALPAYNDDWLIVAGDIGETVEQTRYALTLLNQRFAQLLWVPGNHDLWTNASASNAEDQLRGEAKYWKLVEVCRELGVLTPEDPYVRWEGEGQRRYSRLCSCSTITRFVHPPSRVRTRSPGPRNNIACVVMSTCFMPTPTLHDKNGAPLCALALRKDYKKSIPQYRLS